MLSALLCLASTLYLEARGESFKGQLEVAAIIVNRAELKQKSICSIVREPKQFAFKPIAARKMLRQINIASIVLLGLYRTKNTHFETVGHNYLAETYGIERTERIGNHQFFREACYNARAVRCRNRQALASSE